MGVVYHGNYFTWFESARIELLDQMKCPYRELESSGFYLPVLSCQATFLSPARFDDRLSVTVFLEEEPSLRIHLRYETHCSDRLLAHGSTTHAFVDERGRPMRPPQRFVDGVRLWFRS